MSWLRRLAKRSLERLGYRVSRAPANRFQAMEETLGQLAGRGYRPRVVIDGGANRGEWARVAHAVFPNAALHLVEPQIACAPELEELVRRLPAGSLLHPVALTAPGTDRVLLHGSGTGAWVTPIGGASSTGPAGDPPQDLACPASTLDALFADRVGPTDRALLKLDLEGHELTALRGSVALLARIEVIVAEVSFYPIEGAEHNGLVPLAAHLAKRGFELHDFASLSGRRRDHRLRQGDALFVSVDSPLSADRSWA